MPPVTLPSYIQLAADGTGKKVRNLEMVTVDPVSGAESTVYVQVVAILSPNGEIIDPSARTNELLELVLEKLSEVSDSLRSLTDCELAKSVGGDISLTAGSKEEANHD